MTRWKSVAPATRVLRGLSLRCPDCGRGGILANWFQLRAACLHCGLLLDRGNRDFFIGAYLINLIVSEVLFAVILFVFVMQAWPDPPWDLIQWLAVAAIVIAPMATYPFTKSTWLAVDLIFQPPTDKDRDTARESGISPSERR